MTKNETSGNQQRIYNALAGIYPLWRDALLEGAETNQVEFLTNTFRSSFTKIRSVIDLGCGVGTHAGPLAQQGFDVTGYDKSPEALRIASRTYPSLRAIRGSFEKINLEETFDASICMWSTINYILNKADLHHFMGWLSNHVHHIIVIDQPNFHKYPSSFQKTYRAENDTNLITIKREWTLDQSLLRKTSYEYDLLNKNTGIRKKIYDSETQQFFQMNTLTEIMGNRWELVYALGDYSLSTPFDAISSKRMITVYKKL
ncbi:class I SAM-dependent methyltransferase [Candidatus Woesearchaeota archaeon]|nr:class I SAM-dependent methyltransferase [Candidatus Woesearchaeota archaeon]